ncbi:MAG: cytochrome P450 [Polyangia bacterium]
MEKDQDRNRDRDKESASAAEFRAAREATGPAPVSLWQLLRGYRADPYERWTRIREEHGEVARYRFALSDTFLISGADGARRVLQDNAANYSKDHGSYRMLRRLFGNGLLTSEGSFWLRQRRLAQPAFHRERITAMGARMCAMAQETAAAWQRRLESDPTSSAPISMMEEMSQLTLKVVGDALFGTGLAQHAGQVAAAWKVLNSQLATRFSRLRLLPPILPTRYDREFREARRTLFDIVDRIITERRARGGDHHDLLAMFMAAHDADTDEHMTDRQLRDEVVTMLLAGHETTAVTLTWAWARLDRDRRVLARLHDELTAVLGDRPPRPEDFGALMYTRAVVAEALRLHPAAYIINRRVRENDVICGRRVYKGGSIVISPMLLHRHPAYWEQPDEFVPERWLDAEAEKRRPRFAYIPFSSGPRQCIGSAFSLMEATLVLATLAQRFDASLLAARLPRTEYLVLARPEGTVPIRLRPRTPAEARAVA